MKNSRVYRIGKVPISITSVEDVTETVLATVDSGGKGYVCISNMRTVVAANKDEAYLKVMEESLLNTPDGTPLVWCGRAWGLKEVRRVVGLDVFNSLLSSGGHHFFLGDTDETLEALTQKLSGQGVCVAGSYSPPFAPLESYDLKGIADRINESGASVVWLSLRAPKQDFLAAALLPYLNGGIVLIGVGAAFRILLGEYELNRGFLQRIGLGGFKMMRNTTFGKALKWYFVHGFHLIGYMVSILAKRARGKRPEE